MKFRYYCLQQIGILTLLGIAVIATLAIGLERHHEPADAPRLHLNNNQKWSTDASLRQGMSHIRELFTPSLPAIQADKLAASDYDRLAAGVDAQVAFIVQNCRLDKEADAMLHLVLAKLMAGANAMAGKDKQLNRREGALQVVQTLQEYGDYFAHPGW